MSKTLLVYEIIPEDHKFYLIPNEVANEYRHFLEEAHNLFLNVHAQNDGMCFLNNALSTKKVTDWDDGEFNQYRGLLAEYATNTPICDTYISHVYLSGFAL